MNLIALFWLAAFCCGCVFCGKPALLNYNPVANSKAVVTVGNVRFTVLTSRIIRIERSFNGKFQDQATVAILNRYFDKVPTFSQSTTNNVLTIKVIFTFFHSLFFWTSHVTNVRKNVAWVVWSSNIIFFWLICTFLFLDFPRLHTCNWRMSSTLLFQKQLCQSLLWTDLLFGPMELLTQGICWEPLNHSTNWVLLP